MKFSGDEKKLYASGGNDNWIAEYAVENKKLIFKDTIVLGKKWRYQREQRVVYHRPENKKNS
ncbi:hypothetical protein [Hydrobacter penzbergensis]|uniref:hypothetical protein n=1 Tax=Hydrobacter penzbergensis TaxID=1235997 RepID=UPI000B8952E7|nr:hypothetical protein [Hydrobacter penzbergensis]